MSQAQEFMNPITIPCPVCKTHVLPVGLANHIIGKARMEVYNLAIIGKSYKNSKHQTFMTKSVSFIRKRKWDFCYNTKQ